MKMQFAPALRIAAVVAGTVVGSQSAFAGVTATIEGPGVQQSSQSGIVTETFDRNSLVPGTKYSSITSGLGTYTSANSAIILSADQYGGANGSHYLSLGSQSGSAAAITLTLNGPADYFGMWWSAVDGNNHVDFYNGAALVGSFGRSQIVALINATVTPSAYFGNPNDGHQNSGEPYAYVNFSGATFDRIVFSNDGSTGTGFESDNHSIHSVPEPSALAMAGAASIIGLAVARRRRKA